MVNIFKGKNVLITGGTGSIGSEIARKILQYEPGVVRILDNDEDGLFNLEHELRNRGNVRSLIGDVRDEDRLRMAAENTNIIFHAAALKHVPLCEYNPFEAIKTNVIGTQNIIQAASREGVERLINISTDKAVNPINVMGATKLLTERLVTSANYYSKSMVLSCVRFGNVVGTRGSVIPFFAEQIKRGGPVTITDSNMSRFIMSPGQVTELLFRATEIAIGGEIFILKMPCLKISDLIAVMISELAPKFGYQPSQVEIKTIGIRPGEKIHEELMTVEESRHARETKEMFIVVPHVELSDYRIEDYPHLSGKPVSIKQYTSDEGTFLTRREIEEMLRQDFLLETSA